MVQAAMNDQTPFERFQAAARPDPGRPLDSKNKRNCASFGPQAHFRRVNPDGSVDLVAAGCDRWACPRCAPRLRTRLVEEIQAAVAQHGLTQWLHLTLRHDTGPRPRQDAAKLLRKWRALRDVYAKHFHTRLPFIWFKHIEKGRPHLHIFTRGVDLKWVEAQWKKRTGAFEIKLQDIDLSTMPKPAKYATRQIHANASEYARACGRWWGTSQDIHLDVRRRGRGEGVWLFCAGPIDMRGYADDEYDTVRVDEVARPTHVRIKPQGSNHES